MKKCPMCAEQVQDEARVCRFCQYRFDGPPVPPPPPDSWINRMFPPGRAEAQRKPLGCGGVLVIGVLLLIVVAGGLSSKQPDGETVTADQINEIADKANRQKAFYEQHLDAPPGVVNPAPVGSPAKVAAKAIADAGHPCVKVDNALRLPGDGSIRATCSGGETYLVFNVKDAGTVALNCAAAQKYLGVSC